MSGQTRLLLVGGGHTHLEILRRKALEPLPGVALSLVSAVSRHHYSGMVPGFLAGMYSEADIAFDLASLTARAGGTFLEAKAAALDPARCIVRLEDGREIGYDLVSFGIGSDTRGSGRDAVAERAELVKPIHRAVALRQRISALAARASREPVRAAVVGAGAAGIELACAMAAVFDRARQPREIEVLEASERILAGYSRRFVRKTREVLREKRISVRTGARARSVSSESVDLEDGSSVPSELTVWLTGPEAYGVFRESGLPLDDRGFLLTDDSLRSIGDPRVYAVGDCGTLAHHPATPKAGVYAVREGPVLWESLKAALAGGRLPRYEPQKGFLSILNTADGKALLRYGPLVSYSRWAWLLKDRIDRGFMRRYQSLPPGPAPRTSR